MLANTIFNAGIGIILLNYFLGAILSLFKLLNAIIRRYFFPTFTIYEDDEAYEWIDEWSANTGMIKFTSNYTVKTKWPTEGAFVVTRPNVIYVPYFGLHVLFYQRHIVLYF